jgi:hypothetical protein
MPQRSHRPGNECVPVGGGGIRAERQQLTGQQPGDRRGGGVPLLVG